MELAEATRQENPKINIIKLNNYDLYGIPAIIKQIKNNEVLLLAGPDHLLNIN